MAMPKYRACAWLWAEALFCLDFLIPTRVGFFINEKPSRLRQSFSDGARLKRPIETGTAEWKSCAACGNV